MRSYALRKTKTRIGACLHITPHPGRRDNSVAPASAHLGTWVAFSTARWREANFSSVTRFTCLTIRIPEACCLTLACVIADLIFSTLTCTVRRHGLPRTSSKARVVLGHAIATTNGHQYLRACFWNRLTSTGYVRCTTHCIGRKAAKLIYTAIW